MSIANGISSINDSSKIRNVAGIHNVDTNSTNVAIAVHIVTNLM